MCGKEYLKALAVIAAFVTCGSASLSAAEFSPAMFVDGKKSLGNLIEMPEVDGDFLVFIYCSSSVSKSGRMSDVVCTYEDESEIVFAKMVEKASKAAKLSPATLNGEKQKILLQFTVIFLKDRDGAEVQVLNNVRENVAKYGVDYIGAQRIGLHDFPSECTQHFDWFALIRISVSAGGSPGNLEFDHSSDNMPDGCAEVLRTQILASKYIPAFHHGNPVDSVYSEPWFGNYYFR